MFELSAEVEETISRIDLDPHVIGTMVLNNDGSVLKTTVDSTMTSQVLRYSKFSKCIILTIIKFFGAILHP